MGEEVVAALTARLSKLLGRLNNITDTRLHTEQLFNICLPSIRHTHTCAIDSPSVSHILRLPYKLMSHSFFAWFGLSACLTHSYHLGHRPFPSIFERPRKLITKELKAHVRKMCEHCKWCCGRRRRGGGGFQRRGWVGTRGVCPGYIG